MKRFYGIKNFRSGERAVLTLGMFDGMHLGHREILSRLVSVAREQNLAPIVLTFDIHPRRLTNGIEGPPRLLMSLKQRLAHFEECGVATAYILRFNRTIRDLSAGDFLTEVIAGQLRAGTLVVGYDSKFGKDRQGDLGFLRREAPALGIGVIAVDAVIYDGEPISSTRLRKSIESGNVNEFRALAGRDFSVHGAVVRDRGRGKEIGYPTANLDIEGRLAYPRGVWTGYVNISNKRYPSLTNIGYRPTFKGKDGEYGPEKNRMTVETHIVGFSGNLYDGDLEVYLTRKIREERRFDSAGELARQIAEDIKSLKE